MATKKRIQTTITITQYDDQCKKCKECKVMFDVTHHLHPIWVGEPENGGEYYLSIREAEKAVIRGVKKALRAYA